LGEGSFGQVYLAKHRETGKKVAIKLIKNLQNSVYNAKKVLREIELLSKLSELSENIFTVKLLEVILPACVDQDISK
jgi:serine/threonine protein kinase